jgi:hypothetical protein
LAPFAQRKLSCLLDWQLWYWGQDIHHAAGNPLLGYGFQRVRGPGDGTQRSSAYVLTHAPLARHSLHGLSELIAWGFGLTATHEQHAPAHGALQLVRHERSPGLCSAPVHAFAGTRESLPPRTVPRSSDEWACLCATISAVALCCADYEVWATQQLGVAHRVVAHQRRPRVVRRKHTQPTFLHEAWRQLAHCIEDNSSTNDAIALVTS